MIKLVVWAGSKIIEIVGLMMLYPICGALLAFMWDEVFPDIGVPLALYNWESILIFYLTWFVLFSDEMKLLRRMLKHGDYDG